VPAKRYKLIVTDVDGTLLDANSNLPAPNRKALLECMDACIGVILATGKTIDAIYPLVRSLNLKLPQITQSGAVTVNRDLRIISSTVIGPDHYLDVVKTIKREGGYPLACLSSGKIFYEKYHPDMDHIKKVGEKLIPVDSLQTPYFSHHATILSTAIAETHPLDRLLRDKYSSVLQVVRSGQYFFDILNLKATKGNALLKLLEVLNIDPKSIAAFGDSPNDLSLFEVAGLKIAVGNAYQSVLDQADIITAENYRYGLAQAIYGHLLS